MTASHALSQLSYGPKEELKINVGCQGGQAGETRSRSNRQVQELLVIYHWTFLIFHLKRQHNHQNRSSLFPPHARSGEERDGGSDQKQ